MTLLRFIICILVTSSLYSQEDLALFSWESHLPYNTGMWVTQSDDYIYYATNLSLLQINKSDLNARFISKVEGLSDAGIKQITYDEFNNAVVIIYNSSNIDFYSENGVFNIPDIVNNSSIIGSKEINHVHVADRSTIFLSTAFGIVEYCTDRSEFGSTVFTPFPINEITTVGSQLYAATDDGLYFIDQAENSNIADFSRWELLGTQYNLPVLYEATHLVAFQGKVYFSTQSEVYKSTEAGNFVLAYEVPFPGFTIQYLSPSASELMVGLRSSNDSKIVFYNGREASEGANDCIDRLRYSIKDELGRIWYADRFREFRFQENGNCRRLNFNSPLTETGSDIAINGDNVAIASGGVTDNFQDLFSRDGIYLLNEKSWNNINENNLSAIRDNEMLNLYRVAFSPDGQELLMGSFWNGLLYYNLEDESTEVFTDDNSSLQNAVGDPRTRISDLQYDDRGRLWISNYNAARPLVMRDVDGTWYNFATNQNRAVGDLTIDELGNVWVVTFGTNGSIYVFNPGEDLSAINDDQRKVFNLNNSEITTSIIYTVETDLNGDVWVGTAEGAIVFECGSSVYEDLCRGERREVSVDSILAFLLETEEVRTIAFDGANRKWFGTRNGIFVQSENGSEEIARFNVDNSPLFDNEVVDLAFNGEDGRMYISTNKGLQAIRTETTSARNVHSNNVYAFPNPVAPDYLGPIAIKGLAKDAIVKITDLSGRLVYETIAFGGQAIWDGNSLDGKRAATGVYLVFSTGTASFGNPDSFVTKILFIE